MIEVKRKGQSLYRMRDEYASLAVVERRLLMNLLTARRRLADTLTRIGGNVPRTRTKTLLLSARRESKGRVAAGLSVGGAASRSVVDGDGRRSRVS